MATPNLSELITTTLRRRDKKIIDNFTNKNALLKRLKDKGKVKKVSGGRTIVKPIYYDDNNTFQRYADYETLNTAASDVISAAEYEWKQANVNVVISGAERRKNSGESQLFDLLESRIENAILTMENNICSDLYSAGTADGGKQINGLQALVAGDPTTGTVGGINRATYTFWRNQAYDFSANAVTPSATTIQAAMNDQYVNCLRGADQTDLILAANNYWLFYLASLQANQRFTDADSGMAGFTSIKFMNADVVPDGGSGIPTSTMYFLNTNYLSFDVHPDAFMSPDDEITSINQDAVVVPIRFMGNLTMSNAARQGIVLA